MNLKSGPRIRKFTALMCATVLEIILIPPVATAIQEASVSGGTVSGVIKHGVVSFKGIEATNAGVLPTFAAICSMLYLGSPKSSKARKPCASSIG